MVRELVCGLSALALAGVYYAAAAGLPTSFLSDDVGADGLPKALAIALGLLGVLAISLAAFRRKPATAGSTRAGGNAAHLHLRALGMLALGGIYAALTPWLGYLTATVALIFVVAAYSGQRLTLRLAAISGAGGLTLWVMFVKLLGVAMPAGILAPLLG